MQNFVPRIFRARVSYTQGMEKLRILFVKTAYDEAELLGRRVRDYVEREMQEFECEYCADFEEAEKRLKGEVFNVVLPLSCPLARAEDVKRIAKSMSLKGLRVAKFHSSRAYIVRGKSLSGGIFVGSPAFFEISDAKSYSLVYNTLRDRIADGHLSRGVTIFDPRSTFIDDTVEIGENAQILPFCRIQGRTKIESGAVVSASTLVDTVVRAGACVECSHVVGSTIGENASVGPFARLRSANIGKGCRIGDFVEIKASTIGDGTKSAHLTYIGDATVGERTNVGCGTVFCNYDGKEKHKTQVGNDCFVGANVNLVAPVRVGDNCFVAAGTTVTKDLADNTFAIGRTMQKTKFNTPKQQD